jgi:hypothetical protein
VKPKLWTQGASVLNQAHEQSAFNEPCHARLSKLEGCFDGVCLIGTNKEEESIKRYMATPYRVSHGIICGLSNYESGPLVEGSRCISDASGDFGKTLLSTARISNLEVRGVTVGVRATSLSSRYVACNYWPIWLILPVVICFFQGLSHANVSGTGG